MRRSYGAGAAVLNLNGRGGGSAPCSPEVFRFGPHRGLFEAAVVYLQPHEPHVDANGAEAGHISAGRNTTMDPHGNRFPRQRSPIPVIPLPTEKPDAPIIPLEENL